MATTQLSTNKEHVVLHPMPKDSGGVSPTCALSNGQTDLSPTFDPDVTCEPALASLYWNPGTHEEHCLRPMDERAFVEVQISRREDPPLSWGKNKQKEFSCMEVGCIA